MLVSAPRIRHSGLRSTYEADVRGARGRRTLWYEVARVHGPMVSEAADAAVVALLIPAMAAGEDIDVIGPVSPALVSAIPALQRILVQVIPTLREVRLRATRIHDAAPVAAGVATGFSGGIDSFCVLADHAGEAPTSRPALTHLLFNNVGSHGTGAVRLYQRRLRRLAPLAERFGLPMVAVNSNVDAFYTVRLDFQQTHTLRNASVALVLQRGLHAWLYASGASDQDMFVGPSRDLASCDAMTLPLLSSPGLRTMSVGSELTRVEKTLRVAGMPDSHDGLDVCVDPHHDGRFVNCSRCWKCLRTLTTLEIGGMLDLYARVFDLAAYRRHRDVYLASIASSRDPLVREVAAFARHRGFPLPRPSAVCRASHSIAALARPVIRRLIGSRPSTAPPIRLFHFRPLTVRNVGDRLNVPLLRAITDRPVVSAAAATADATCIGSLLEMLLERPGLPPAAGPPMIVWGAGFIAAPGATPSSGRRRPERFARPMAIRAVRGRLTLDRLREMGIPVEGAALGDPGLLAGLIADRPRAGATDGRRFRLGLVPHYADASAAVWRAVQARLRHVLIVSVAESPARFLSRLRQCDAVVSSAMHGLVLADALGIPNMRAKISDRLIGGDYKFSDYYSVFGISPAVLTTDDLLGLVDADIDRIRSSYAVTPEAVSAIAAGLLESCPFHDHAPHAGPRPAGDAV